jgi:uncharacterized protein YbjT (DUF2867 family)
MILITGAAGQNGMAIINEFIKHKERMRILVRNAKDAQKFDNPLVDIFIGDMSNHETLNEALKGVTKAVLISSADPEKMAETQKAFIDAASAAGVRHIIKLSCLNADINSSARFIQMHGEIEKHLEASGMTWTHIRPTHFMQNYLLDVPTIAAQNAFYYPMGGTAVAPIDVHDLARVFYKVVTGNGHENKAYELSGPEALTMDDIAARYSKALGRTIHYINVPPESFRQQLVSFGMPEALADAINELYDERRKGTESAVRLGTHKLLGITPTTFAEFINQNMAVFGGTSMQ